MCLLFRVCHFTMNVIPLYVSAACICLFSIQYKFLMVCCVVLEYTYQFLVCDAVRVVSDDILIASQFMYV